MSFKGLTMAALAALAGASVLVTAPLALAADKVVNVYNWSDYVDPAVLEDFTKETGIKVKYDVYDSNEILETKLLAGKTGYDIVVPTSSYMARQIKAGVLQKLDKSKLSNLANAWPWVNEKLQAFDPGNEHAVNYMWGTTGVGYNVKKIKAIMPDAPIGSWKMVFDPAIAAKFKDCGIMMLDTDEEVIPAMLSYMGKDPRSTDPEDFKAAAAELQKVRPFIRKFHSSEYINAIANGDVCLALGWSGDFSIAGVRAAEKNKEIKDEAQHTEIAYYIPTEGANMWFDSMVIPKDAPHVEEAHAFINYMLRPDVIAKCTAFIGYANGNIESQKLLDKALLENTTVYPDKATQERLFTLLPLANKVQRARTDAWRSVKTGG